MKKVMFIFLLGVFVAMPGYLLAEEEKADIETTILDEVVVSVSRIAEKKKEVTSNILIIDEKRIRSSIAADLGELLIELGLGHITKYPGCSTSIGVRGFRTERHGNDLQGHVLVLLDGRRAGTGNVAKIATKNIERVEIIRGPASVQFGSAAMGGIINVITRQGKDKPTLFVEVDMERGSVTSEEKSVGFSGQVDKFDFSGSFSAGSMDDEYTTGGGETYLNTGFDKNESISLNIGYEFFPGNRIGFMFRQFEVDHTGNPNYLSQNDSDDYSEIKNSTYDFNYDGSLAEGMFIIKAKCFNGRDEDKWFDPSGSNPTGWNDDVPSVRQTEQQGAQGQISFNKKLFLITAGMDWVDYEVETSWSPAKVTSDNLAYFALAKVRLFEARLIFSSGLRYDQYAVKVIDPAGNPADDDNLSFRCGAAYMLTDYLKVRANYGEAFVMPDANQMAADYIIWGKHYLGNPDLDPQKSKTYEGGVDFIYESMNLALTYFYSDFKNKIETEARPGSIETWVNLGSAAIQGIEGEFLYDIGDLFDWDFKLQPFTGFVWLTQYENKEENKDLLDTSNINASLGLAVSELKGLSARVNFVYNGAQTVEDWESGVYPVPEIKMVGFWTADFMVEKKILDFKKYGGLTLKGAISNLFDKDHAYTKGYPMPGRSFSVGIRYDF